MLKESLIANWIGTALSEVTCTHGHKFEKSSSS